MRRFVLIPHIKIHNANAMSSPYTIGFPAMTAWLGAVHALQRKLRDAGLNELTFPSVAVSCHDLDLQTYKGDGDYVHSIIGTSNPLDKDGSRPAFIEEARCHLEISLLIEYSGLDPDDNDRFIQEIDACILRMKMASGDIQSAKKTELLPVDEDDEGSVRALVRKLMLGHVLVERRELMIAAMKNGEDALSALINHLSLQHRSKQDSEGKVTWTRKRREPSWLVPIAVGFQGISDLGKAANQRDMDTPHRFAESIVTLGEFVMPYRISNLDHMLWQYHIDQVQNLYVCRTIASTSNTFNA
ncbi:type I-F CRISPR-associated protein Csy2 [Undibacterium sp. Jales W-56]|uniref:type I-F CRISPR-associated protein Csy2 n=1 Tax=Undibacterium sp. Jales W-56 TaxID=2897325 RepID=UPI0021D3D244|nr:type I-F CRISPR-associated protein Csy2 [Undibacterium sp. Jales W-56]MCU6435464.1 type I-F CRISPR-associated protein Csy2 [Undibacterium sp. Jales W-56]